MNALRLIFIFLTGIFSMSANAENVKVEIVTSEGTMIAELYADKAPKTVANFLSYVDEGHYSGIIFHRVIENFMIQTGGFDANMKQKATRAPIENEADNGLGNVYGSLAMARTSDPHSASAQFFINQKDNTFLNHSGKNPQGWGYAVFGQVTSGNDVIEKIAAARTGFKGGMQDVPLETISIERIARVAAE